MASKDHCAACGETVECYEVDVGGVTETRCLQCGLPLGRKAEGGRHRFRRVLVADDSAFFTEGIETFLRGRDLAEEVLRAADGALALEAATASLRSRKPLDLVILDLLMPRLNGFHSAISLRAVERGFEAHPADILFLSSRRVDPKLKPLLTELAPAYYLNKGGGGELLGRRLEEVLRAIAEASQRAGLRG